MFVKLPWWWSQKGSIKHMHVHLLILLHQFKIEGTYSTNKSTATHVAWVSTNVWHRIRKCRISFSLVWWIIYRWHYIFMWSAPEGYPYSMWCYSGHLRTVQTTFPPEVVSTYTCNQFIRCVSLALVSNDLGLCCEGVADLKVV